MGLVVPAKDFLDALQRLTKQHGALLIFDEVMTGFRVAYGGAQELFGVRPDLTTLGKIVGGGMPLAAYGGRREIMDQILPAGKVFQAGTLSGNPIATAAGAATLKVLKKDPPYARLEKKCARLAAGLSAAAKSAGVPHQMPRVGSMLTLFFNAQHVTDWDVASQSDTNAYARFFWNLIDRGIYFPCSQYEALFVSDQHSDDDIERTIAAAKESLLYRCYDARSRCGRLGILACALALRRTKCYFGNCSWNSRTFRSDSSKRLGHSVCCSFLMVSRASSNCFS
jgi:glutamate-1-semialdehyde 2,1-aminomutase